MGLAERRRITTIRGQHAPRFQKEDDLRKTLEDVL